MSSDQQYFMSLWRGLCKGLRICASGSQCCFARYSRLAVKDHYQVLGVERNATSGEIKNAFFTLSKKFHPDKDPSNPLLHAEFVRINEAYRVLSKNSSRREYDHILGAIQRGWAAADLSRRPTSTNGPGTTRTYRKTGEPYHWTTRDSGSSYGWDFPPRSEWREPVNERYKRNMNVVWTCIIWTLLSLYLHYCVFSTLRDMRKKEQEEEQQRIWEFYNTTRDSARANGSSKQREILLQKHEERLRKLYGREEDPKK